MKRLKVRICLCFLFVFLTLPLLKAGLAIETGSEQEIRNALSTCMEQVRQRIPDDCARVDRVREKYGLALIPFLEEYTADPNEHVRWEAFRSMILVGLDSNNVTARRKIVDKLVRRLEEEEQVALNWQYLLQRLARFTSADFSEPSRQLVRNLLLRALADTPVSRRGDIILLAGVADLKSELPRLKQFIDEHEGKLKQQHEENLAQWRATVETMPERRRAYYADTLLKQYWQNSLVWAALRARARMGVKEDIARCIELVESHPYENYRVAGLLEELSYVRQPEVVDYLSKYLNSDKMAVYNANDVEFMSYAQHAAIALGQMLHGFPHKKDYGLTKETIERCRKWMAEQKQWDIIR